MARDVKCEVNSCIHWAAGNECKASSIYVVSRMNNNQASTSTETDCKTFEPKI
ncbi:DUF1540 domain-containing protein [Ammoniphilus sp. CFH 90114]|uniref:DUF1540 domain-containing protein n=1 Tax=Ammoniphilus sp. CFH 90114 TaxID=2493665 RepID=UPI00100FF761|nr:DUF1540 domain-containing protein [Ammoniphilus sp. CFH 90114]RXT03810.1 DUF1540 domain-containing protein [Ammoniphilus sp. CFH 90114]